MLRRRTPLGTPHLSPDVVAELSEMAQAALPLETGGILLGWYEHHDIRITDAIAVEDPAATATSYSRGNEAGNAALAAYMKGQPAGSPLGYVGEWHSHPGPAGPSPLDMLSFIGIAEAANQPLVQVVMALHGNEWRPVVRMSRITSRFSTRRRR